MLVLELEIATCQLQKSVTMPLQLAGRALLEYLQLSLICHCMNGLLQSNIIMPLKIPVR